jgi:pilus assembly protein Flp/PilA
MPKFWMDRRGVTSLEYGLLAGALALSLIAALRVLAGELGTVISQMLASHSGGSG